MINKIWNRFKPFGWLALLLAIGAISIIYKTGSLPPGLNQDEASIGYDAFAILHYGMDRNGVRLPVHLISWGSGQNALYAYLSMPFIYIFGLHVWSVRAVAMLFGFLGLILVYLVGKRLFGSERGGLIALFVAVASPWHMMMSRWALESNLLPTLILLAFYFLLRGLEKPRWLFAFSVTLGLSMYAYGTAYLFVPLFACMTAVFLFIRSQAKLYAILMQAGLLTLTALPIIMFVWINRYGTSGIETAFFGIPMLTLPRVEEISSVFSGQAFTAISGNLAAFAELMWTGQDGLLWNSVAPYGYLYPIGLPLAVIGAGYFAHMAFRGKRTEAALLLLWFIASLVVAAVTDVNINRINLVFYPMLLFAAGGIVWLAGKVRYALIVALTAFGLCFGFFAAHYFTSYGESISQAFYESFGEAIQYASDETGGTVHVAAKVNMPYVYVLFYERISPVDFAATVVYRNPDGAFRQVESFGRYVFGKATPQPGRNAAYIFANSEVPYLGDLADFRVRKFKHYTVIVGEEDELVRP